jgi:hypothetical protein
MATTIQDLLIRKLKRSHNDVRPALSRSNSTQDFVLARRWAAKKA